MSNLITSNHIFTFCIICQNKNIAISPSKKPTHSKNLTCHSLLLTIQSMSNMFTSVMDELESF